MSKRTVKVVIWPANGGLDITSIPGTVAPSRLEDCDNIVFADNGSREKRPGLASYYRSGFTPTIDRGMRGMFDYWRNVTSVQTQKVVVFAGAYLWADANDGRFVDVSGATTLYINDQVTFDVFVGYLMAFFENARPQYWDMTGTFGNMQTQTETGGAGVPDSFATSPPELIRVHRSRAWASGQKAAPHRIFYSAPDAPEDYRLVSGGGSIDIDQGDSDPIGFTALFPSFFGDLYVAKRRSLYRIREATAADLSTTAFQVDPICKGIGCIAHNSVVATPNDIIWASERGIHSLKTTDQYGDTESTFLSFPIHRKYQDEVNFTRSKNMWAVYDPDLNSYLLAYTRRGKSKNTEILGFNIVSGEWYQWHDIDCAAMCQFVDNRFKTRILIAQEALKIGQLDNDLVEDFGSSYSMYFTTPIIYPLGRPDLESNFKYLWLFVKPQDAGEIKVTYQIDGKTAVTETVDQTGVGAAIIGEAIIGESIIGGSGVIKKIAVPLKGTGAGIIFSIAQIPETSDTGEDCNIYGYILEVETAEDSALPTVI